MVLSALGCDRVDLPGRSAASAEPIENPAGDGSREPSLTAAQDGRVYLTWMQLAADSTYSLRMSALDGAAWTEPVQIASGRDFWVNWADFPALAVLSDGQLAAHWLERIGDGRYDYEVRIALSDDSGATWSDGIVPHRDGTLAEHGFVSMWPVGDGTVGAAWLDGRQFADESTPRDMLLMHTTIGSGGELGAETVLDSRVCDCCQTSAVLTSGGPVLVYRDRSPDELRDIAIVRQVDGQWTEPAVVHRDGWRIEACPVNGPAVAAGDGTVGVAWFTAAQDSARVLAALSSDAGASFGEPVRVDDGHPLGRVDALALEGGELVVTWLEQTGGERAEVRARLVTESGPGRAVVIGETAASRASGFPRAAQRVDELIVAWTVPGTPSRVAMARVPLSLLR